MPVAAVPNYLRRHLTDANYAAASPGLRFGLLLPIWTTRQDQGQQLRERAAAKSREGRALAERLRREPVDKVIEDLVADGKLPRLWTKNESGGRSAWEKVAALSKGDKERMRALADRQKALWQNLPETQRLKLEAEAVAPFTTGLGNEHPLENGFAFLSPYGLPYLAGSGVKGVVRQAARELASGEWGDPCGWSTERRYDWPLEREADSPPPKLSMFDVLFGRETEEGEKEHFRGVLTFWDVIPQIAGDGLLVEIMTPHYSEYYQQKRAGDGGRGPQRPQVLTPHDSGQPNPISFLTIPPGSRFEFYVTCDTVHLARIARDLAENSRWKRLLNSSLEHAFRWLGFGAKTAVGYGAMQQAPGATSVGALGTAAPTRAAEAVWRGAVLRYDPGQRTVTATLGNQRSAPLRSPQVEQLMQELGPERAERLRSRRSLENVDVRVEQEGNLIKIVGLGN